MFVDLLNSNHESKAKLKAIKSRRHTKNEVDRTDVGSGQSECAHETPADSHGPINELVL